MELSSNYTFHPLLPVLSRFLPTYQVEKEHTANVKNQTNTVSAITVLTCGVLTLDFFTLDVFPFCSLV